MCLNLTKMNNGLWVDNEEVMFYSELWRWLLKEWNLSRATNLKRPNMTNIKWVSHLLLCIIEMFNTKVNLQKKSKENCNDEDDYEIIMILSLKTLFNIVEARLLLKKKLWCLYCMIMFSCINNTVRNTKVLKFLQSLSRYLWLNITIE